MLRTLKLKIAYDGGNYRGWQIQPNGPTIQQKITDAVAAVTGTAVQPVAAGRTDSGVHAVAQIAHCRLDTDLTLETLQRALNANLPHDIRIHSIAHVHDDFDAVRDATGKLYRYVYNDAVIEDVFCRGRAWVVHYRLDVDRMRAAALALLGRHDFRAFESEWPNRVSSIRTIRRCRPMRFGDFIYLDVAADGFLYNMVRAIAGSLYEVGRGKWPVERVAEALAAGDRSLAGPTAPACGLYLLAVDYE